MHGLVRHRYSVYFFVGILSIALSYWISARQAVINPDAICYLQSAETFNTNVWLASHLCDQARWPFYSILIFIFSQVSHFSYQASAYFLNGIFSLLSAFSFIAIVHALKGSTRVVWLVAPVILLAHEFNDVKQYIVRDHGFWAFYLLSIFFLLRFFENKKFIFAIAWSGSLILSALFRIEGGVFLLLIPWVAWFNAEESLVQRGKTFFQLHCVGLFAAIGLSGWALLSHHTQFGRVGELVYQLHHGIDVIKRNFSENADALAHHLLNSHAIHEAGLLLSILLLIWYVMSVISNLSIIYSILVIYAWLKKVVSFSRSANLVLWGYILVNIFITAGFLTENMFLSKRYLIALSLVLMLWVPFALNHLIEHYRDKKWLLGLVSVWMIVMSLGGIFDFGYSKKYIRDAGEWLAKNTPASAKIYSNDFQVMYYSHHFGNDIFEKSKLFSKLPEKDWQQYDYVAIRFTKKESPSIAMNSIQEFSNKRGDQVRIYKIIH